MAKFYAWSNIYNGGKTKDISLPNGGVRTVVVERNIIEFGSPVTKAKSGMSEEEWDTCIASKSIRDYPPPEGLGENESPSSFVLRELLSGERELNPDVLLEMSLSHSAIGAFAEDQAAEAEASELSEAK